MNFESFRFALFVWQVFYWACPLFHACLWLSWIVLNWFPWSEYPFSQLWVSLLTNSYTMARSSPQQCNTYHKSWVSQQIDAVLFVPRHFFSHYLEFNHQRSCESRNFVLETSHRFFSQWIFPLLSSFDFIKVHWLQDPFRSLWDPKLGSLNALRV